MGLSMAEGKLVEERGVEAVADVPDATAVLGTEVIGALSGSSLVGP
jgi:hypothetical protein